MTSMSAERPAGGKRRSVIGLSVLGVVLVAVVMFGTMSAAYSIRQDRLATGGTQIEFSLCGQEFRLTDGYIGQYRAPVVAEDDLMAFQIVPLDNASRPTSLEQVITPSDVLIEGPDLPPLPDAIERGISEWENFEPGRISYSDSMHDGCQWGTYIDVYEGRSFEPQPPWVLVVYAS